MSAVSDRIDELERENKRLAEQVANSLMKTGINELFPQPNMAMVVLLRVCLAKKQREIGSDAVADSLMRKVWEDAFMLCKMGELPLERPDRWEAAMRNVAAAMVGGRTEYDLPTIVDMVRKAAAQASGAKLVAMRLEGHEMANEMQDSIAIGPEDLEQFKSWLKGEGLPE